MYDYENHGADWNMGSCGSRSRQSPIDFGASAPWAASPSDAFYYEYEPLQGTYTVENTGKTIAVHLGGKGFGGIVYKNQRYEVSSVNFHTHSEHTFFGKAVPMEAHIVHTSESDDKALVVAVPFQLYVEPPTTYQFMGNGYCNTGYYTGWNAAEATSLQTCSDICTKEANCMFFSLAENKTCSRYSHTAGECLMMYSPNYAVYRKVVRPPSFVLLGIGYCQGGSLSTATAPGLDACTASCAALAECKYAAFSSEKICVLFSVAYSGGCDNRTEGLMDYMTYVKVDPAVSPPLAALVGEHALPEAGQSTAVAPAVPADALSAMLVGGTFFEYEGSLTAPPCTEAITWLVRREALTFSCSQQDSFAKPILEMTSNIGNYRAIMPLMDRDISVFAAVSGRAPTPPSSPKLPGIPVPVDLAAQGQAQEAQMYAWQATDMYHTIKKAMESFPSPGAGVMPSMPGPAPPFGASPVWAAADVGGGAAAPLPPGAFPAAAPPLPAELPTPPWESAPPTPSGDLSAHVGLLSLKRPMFVAGAPGRWPSEAGADGRGESAVVGRDPIDKLLRQAESDASGSLSLGLAVMKSMGM